MDNVNSLLNVIMDPTLIALSENPLTEEEIATAGSEEQARINRNILISIAQQEFARAVSNDNHIMNIIHSPDNIDNHYNIWHRDSPPPPADPEIVDNLPFVTIEEHIKENNECAVCYVKFKKSKSKQVLQMPCSHIFHKLCLVKWLGKTNSCPMCRFELKTNNQSYEDYKKECEEEKRRSEDLATLHNSMFT